MYGYGGSVLRIDLTLGTLHRHPTEEHLARAYLGGRGLNVKRLWDELPAHTGGLSPENVAMVPASPGFATSAGRPALSSRGTPSGIWSVRACLCWPRLQRSLSWSMTAISTVSSVPRMPTPT